MDIEILLALQNFRNGGGTFLTGWVLERRFVGFSTDVPMITRVSRAAEGLLGYYIVSLIFVPLIKNGVPGPAGTVTSCFVQILYVSFIFPWCLKYLERPAAELSKQKRNMKK